MALCDPESEHYFGIMESWQDRNSTHPQWRILHDPNFYSITLVTACVSPSFLMSIFCSLVLDA